MLFIIVMMIGLASITTGENYLLIKDDSIELNSNWVIETNQEKLEQVTLPYKVDVGKGEFYKATTVLPDTDDGQKFLWIRSSMQDLIVTLDGKEIYRDEIEKSASLYYPIPASLWLAVPLPEQSAGKEVTLHIKSDIDVFSGVVNEVKIGSQSSLLFNLLKEQWVGIVVFFILVVLGIATTVFSCIVKGTLDNRLTYLGLFAIVLGIWIVSEGRVLQFVTGNRFILGSISYITFPLIALFFVLYVKEAVATKYNRVFKGFAAFYAILILVIVGLQVFVGMPFIETMNFVLFCVVVIALVTVVLLLVELVKYNNENVKKLLKYIFILIAILLPEALIFYLDDFNITSKFTRLGILIFFILLLRDSYSYFKMSLEKMKENELLEKLAYKDFLTDGFNRTAFERDIELMYKKSSPVMFRLVLIDLNHLKHINDSFGHQAGDTAIKTAFSVISNAFTKSGRSYRIGGDEFAVIIQEKDENSYEESLQLLRKKLEEESLTQPFPLNVGVGSDVFSVAKWNDFTEFYHHVDQRMYEDKLIQKTKSGDKVTISSR